MNNRLEIVKFIFWFGFAVIIFIAIIMVWKYRSIFDGALSNNPSDWADMSSFFYGILTVLLTALNVYLFYSLTSIANEINSTGEKTSNGIVRNFTLAEQQRIRAYLGINLMNKYYIAQQNLLESVKFIQDAQNRQSVDYQKVQLAATQLLSIYKTIHGAKNLFVKTSKFRDDALYQEELNDLIEKANKSSKTSTIITSAGTPQYQTFLNAAQSSSNDINDYYRKVMDLMSEDLGLIYSFQDKI